MSETEKQKTALAANTLQNFFNQFGNDIYADLMLEELFKGLINEETLFVFGEQKQKGNQANHSATEQRISEQQSERHDGPRPPYGLGEEDCSDYP